MIKLKNILLEQENPAVVDRWSNSLMHATGNRSDKDYNTIVQMDKDRMKKNAEFVSNLDSHDAILVTQIAVSLLVPGIGLAIAAGLGVVDAGIYAYEGKSREAGLAMVFAALGALGAIPKVAKITTQVANGIAKKLLLPAAAQKFTETELRVIRWVAQNQNKIPGIISKSKYASTLKAGSRIFYNTAKRGSISALYLGGAYGVATGVGNAYNYAYDKFNKNDGSVAPLNLSPAETKKWYADKDKKDKLSKNKKINNIDLSAKPIKVDPRVQQMADSLNAVVDF